MLFTSLAFCIFITVLFALYWFVLNRSLRVQNLLVLAASYFFYGWWDWRFLSLLVMSSYANYIVGEKLPGSRSPKKLIAICVCANLLILGFFKYFGFFVNSFVSLACFAGLTLNVPLVEIILPLGISFYTFRSMSYVIDVHRGQVEPSRDIVAFFAFVSFFPLLVAGPIERAKKLLPQFQKPRVFDEGRAVDGMRQVLLGFFKKLVIADSVAPVVEAVFSSPEAYHGLALFFGAALFSFQIYCDFSGYSDIAIGSSRLFGFDLMRNFRNPYFSRDIAEFWRRWHISLTTWFRDYLYIPLGGSRAGKGRTMVNTLVVFLLSGLWHGANWTFVAWGLLHWLYFIPLLITGASKKHISEVAGGRSLPSFSDLLYMVITFILVTFAWIFFRAESISGAFEYIGSMIETIGNPRAFREIASITKNHPSVCFIPGLMALEWLARDRQHAFEYFGGKRLVRWTIYYAVIFAIVFYGAFNQAEFIYLQF